MSEDNKQESSEQELSPEQLETVAGGAGTAQLDLKSVMGKGPVPQVKIKIEIEG